MKTVKLIGKVGSSLPFIYLSNYSQTAGRQREEILSLISKMPEEMREKALSELKALFALSKAERITHQAIMTLLNPLNQNAAGGSSISVYA